MTEDKAKSQGIYVPNWWLAILLIPAMGGVLWVLSTLSDIKADNRAASQVQAMGAAAQTAAIQGLKDTVEFRLKNIETQGKLNDEHLRTIENRVARIEGKKGIQPESEQ